MVSNHSPNRVSVASSILLTVITLCSPLSGRANGLVGSSVSGTLQFAGFGANYFDPANGFVPTSGYLNTAGTTVTVESPQVEFGFQDSGNLDLANFSSVDIFIEDVVSPNAAVGGTDTAFTMTFTDTSLAGTPLYIVQDNFPNGVTFSLTGDEVTVTWAGGKINPNDDYTAVFDPTPVPEPSIWAMVGVCMAVLLWVIRRRRA